MNSAQVRQAFLDYFAKQQHTVVPSAPLMPSSPNLLFTNAGMNQFVPYFLGEQKAPFSRATDTQKCIRAGGKHNDLDDVGFDTYHHTFFEMLGNWSFGDYFKRESLHWGWELLTKVYGFPKARLYATVYKPDETKGDPASFDQEAYDIWTEIFTAEGMDPKKHIKYGNKKDNFWMMGDTGPCGPCSEIHVDLSPNGDTDGKLVNQDSSRCIEVWNHVFMEFNCCVAADDIDAERSSEVQYRYEPLPAKNVDTGMGFERIAGIIAATKNFTDFNVEPSNYASDLFTEIFEAIGKLTTKKYTATVPTTPDGLSDQEQTDIAYRVIADHVRCVSCAIADGILPSNEGRNYVIRRILRRGVMYARKLDLKVGDLSKLSATVVKILSPTFPELASQQEVIAKVIASEEEAFGKTLVKGMEKFEEAAKEFCISGEAAFELYDTYGFPLDLTEVLASERALSVDKAGFSRRMEAARELSRAAQKKSAVTVQSGEGYTTEFVGYDAANLTNFQTKVIACEPDKYVIVAASPFYAEMGGQLGDTGTLTAEGTTLTIADTKADANGSVMHIIESGSVEPGTTVSLSVDRARRNEIERHHSATHLLDWALRENLGTHIRQAGSSVGPDRLRFDFNHFESVTPDTLAKMELQINQRIIENAAVKTTEIPFTEKPDDVVAVFGEKYGDTVRVVDIGGYSKELCGGTHVAATGQIGFFKILSEGAIAAGTRRIEAVCGSAAIDLLQHQSASLKAAAAAFNTSPDELTNQIDLLKTKTKELETTVKDLRNRQLQGLSTELIANAETFANFPLIRESLPEGTDAESLKNLANIILGQIKDGAVILGSACEGRAHVLAAASKSATAAGFNAGAVIKELTAALDGRGGGRPEMAQGSGTNPSKLESALKAVQLTANA